MSYCNSQTKKRFDYLLWGSLSVILLAYILAIFPVIPQPNIIIFSDSTFGLLNKMWWGVLAGIFFVGVLDRIPRELVMSVFGSNRGLVGILRATLAGVALDLCSHGILLVGMKLYERGISLGQLMAFLIASPWNSISLTLILWALVGFKWMLAFLLLSLLIAIISGLVFERLVANGTLPDNPNKSDLPEEFAFFPELKKQFFQIKLSRKIFLDMLISGLKGSRMILRWIFFGIVLASLMQTFIPPEHFKTFLGPTIAGLAMTLFIATIIEVCSEGSTPIAADILTRANAPGNSFAFLMTGVSTDYTEIMSLKETTKSWKIALFLPLVTLPQVIAIGVILNGI